MGNPPKNPTAFYFQNETFISMNGTEEKRLTDTLFPALCDSKVEIKVSTWLILPPVSHLLRSVCFTTTRESSLQMNITLPSFIIIITNGAFSDFSQVENEI
jgi:hypothetical protein